MPANRILAALHERQLDGVLMYDPLSIRYPTNTTHMQLWAAHNPFRACLVTADGHMILWDHDGYDFLSAYNPPVREVRGGASFFYFQNDDRIEEMAAASPSTRFRSPDCECWMREGCRSSMVKR